MRSLKILPVALALSVMPLAATAQQLISPNEVVDKIVAQEQAEVQSLRQYSPIVETYIQTLRPDKQLGAVPNGDKYFLGRAELAKGVELEPLISAMRAKHNLFGGLGSLFSIGISPARLPANDLPGHKRLRPQHYKFDYVGREFLGEVRCLVFDVDPISKDDKGRFVGRIWVEDQDYHIVRFNGGYSGGSKTSYYFNFDSWRTNAGKNKWLPSFIYSEKPTTQLSSHSGRRRAFGAMPLATIGKSKS